MDLVWASWLYAELQPFGGTQAYVPLVQQLRGAHFFSHDLWSLMLCWYAVMLLAKLMLPERSE
ncbi:hypothetical protein KQ940_18390 [Marinobacterium sp. D7]|uniref:hypothetical protein n=1 Tax=Marinobacterium ramblicola TaxID=2849041 RepID=UPI001C2D14E1|nr:hypothetical protein [Marinobacterium ramblicola]MBV1790029.1 hypothetical protein [Marinobacterium ramblicola]